MGRTIIQYVPRWLASLAFVAALTLVAAAAGAQMSSGGRLNGGGLSGGGGNFGNSAANSDENSDAPQGAVNSALKRGCVDENDSAAADSGLPPCANSQAEESDTDNNGDAAGPATLSPNGNMNNVVGALRGAQGFSNNMNKQSMAAVIQQLGISPDELGSLKSEMATGGLSPRARRLAEQSFDRNKVTSRFGSVLTSVAMQS
jgi:hypothetical protein